MNNLEKHKIDDWYSIANSKHNLWIVLVPTVLGTLLLVIAFLLMLLLFYGK